LSQSLAGITGMADFQPVEQVPKNTSKMHPAKSLSFLEEFPYPVGVFEQRRNESEYFQN